MASNINITLKRNNGTDYDVLYPRTIPSQVVGLLTNGKITTSLLPNSVFDSLYYFSNISSNTTAANLVQQAITNATGLNRSPNGYYFVANNTTVTITGSSAENDTPTLINGSYYLGLIAISDEGVVASDQSSYPTTTTLESGDWVIIQNASGGGSIGDPYVAIIVPVENTYELATTTIDGIVRLSNATTTTSMNGSSKVITEDVLFDTIGTTAGKIAAGDHLHTGVYQPLDADLTALAGLTGTGFVKRTGDTTYAIDTNTYLTSQSQDFGTVTVSDTDTGHTYTETGSAVADTNGDTLLLVSGNKINIDVSPTTDAIRISHVDTSTLSGAYGSAGIASITVDGEGHVTAITSATYNNYTLPLAADGVRGGIQIGATQTETNRAVILTSEKASIALPRQIPAVTLNGSSSNTPSFYAPTGAGLSGSTSQTKQRLNAVTGAAPTWIDSPNIYYDTTTGATFGDIIFDVE
jgi:hypothetical protein